MSMYVCLLLFCRLNFEVDAKFSERETGSAQPTMTRTNRPPTATAATPRKPSAAQIAGGAKILKPFLSQDAEEGTTMSITEQVGKLEKCGDILDFFDICPEYAVTMLNLQCVTYKDVHDKIAGLKDSIHDYAAQRTRYPLAFQCLLSDNGIVPFEDENKLETKVADRFGNLCVTHVGRRGKQLETIARLYVNAFLTYRAAERKYWQQYPVDGIAPVGSDEYVPDEVDEVEADIDSMP